MVVNIQNKDYNCFLWSVLAHLHPPQWKPERVEHYKKYENTLNVKDLVSNVIERYSEI